MLSLAACNRVQYHGDDDGDGWRVRLQPSAHNVPAAHPVSRCAPARLGQLGEVGKAAQCLGGRSALVLYCRALRSQGATVSRPAE